MNPQTRDLISKWLERVEKEEDPFVRMFIAYMCLDAWVTSESGKDSDNQKLKWLKETENQLKESWYHTPSIEVPLNGLLQVGEVEDMRPRHRGEFKNLESADNFVQMIDFIHQVRCNLFHGGKSYTSTHDEDLCKWSADILHNWIIQALAESR